MEFKKNFRIGAILLVVTVLMFAVSVEPQRARACVSPLFGEICLFPYNFTPMDYLPCEGQVLQIVQNQALYSLMGPTFGGNGSTTFALPDLRGMAPAPYLHYCIATNGIYPSEGGGSLGMLSEIVMLPYSKTIGGLMKCDGQTLSITQNQALFALLGTYYGGDGQTTFRLPDLNHTQATNQNLRRPLPGVYYYIYTSGLFPSRD